MLDVVNAIKSTTPSLIELWGSPAEDGASSAPFTPPTEAGSLLPV